MAAFGKAKTVAARENVEHPAFTSHDWSASSRGMSVIVGIDLGTTNCIVFEEAQHSENKILVADEVIKSPGITEKNELVKKIRSKGIPVISEIEFAYRYKGNSKIIAITGSNGKTTTTALIYHMCQLGGKDCAMVGNIGYSFAKQVAENPKPLYVVEISSFQLDDIKTFRPDVAVLTNITEDHLDRYNYNIQNYIDSKFRIAENQQAEDVFMQMLGLEEDLGAATRVGGA